MVERVDGDRLAKRIFSLCHDRYARLREWKLLTEDPKGPRIRVVRLDRIADHNWRPTGPQATLFMIDFERLGHEALRACPKWGKRDELFETYFVQGFGYRESIRILGVCDGTWDYWYQEVKKICGRHFIRMRLWT